MKILLVNKFHYLKGGSEKYYFDLAKLLKEHGHEVAFFSMQDEKNIKTDCKEYFVENSDMNSKNIFKALDVIYSKKNRKAMEKALDDFKPDIVHLNNFQRQLSASIIKPIKKRNIPIVFTAHDLQAICPNKTMLDSQIKICEKCKGGLYKNCIKKKCIKNSKLKSILGAIENSYYRIKKIYKEQIDFIITPSEFYRKKFIEDGINDNKIVSIHNFISIPANENRNIGDYAIYFGRISEEKGIFNLIEAFSRTKQGKLYFAGTGPDEEKLIRKTNKLEIAERVKFLGYLQQNELKKYIDNSRFAVLPSIWYDNCPYSVLETLGQGKTILGSNIGGIPELVKDGVSGLIFKFNDINDLTNKLDEMYNNDGLIRKLSNNAKKQALREYNKEVYYSKLVDIYNKLQIGVKNEGQTNKQSNFKNKKRTI